MCLRVVLCMCACVNNCIRVHRSNCITAEEIDFFLLKRRGKKPVADKGDKKTIKFTLCVIDRRCETVKVSSRP